MCGRYAFYTAPQKLKDMFGLDNLINFPATYNAAPMQQHPVIIKNRAGFARWGFKPEWTQHDDPAMAVKMINARSETVTDKPAFRESWAKKRRCLIPVNGFYEWTTNSSSPKQKQPYYIYNKDINCFGLAGLWSKTDDLITFTILTKKAAPHLEPLHHRMPVMLHAHQAASWFDADIQEAQHMIEHTNAENITFHPVSQRVGKVANDSAALIEETKLDGTLF